MTDPTPVRAGEDAGREATDLLKERIACLIRERDAAAAGSREMNRLRALAEAEVVRLTQERDEALCLAEGPSTLLDLARGSVSRGFELYEAQSTVSALRERVARLEEALRPFAAITPSTLHHDSGREREPYSVVLGHPRDEADFTGADLARARATLTEGAPTDV